MFLASRATPLLVSCYSIETLFTSNDTPRKSRAVDFLRITKPDPTLATTSNPNLSYWRTAGFSPITSCIDLE